MSSPDSTDPLVFCDVVGEEKPETDKSMIGSKKNRKEAEKAVSLKILSDSNTAPQIP